MTTETYTYTPELIPLALIDDNPYQPRLAYADAALDELAQAIRAEGLLQPPVGRRTSDGRVQLAFGHRRRRAFDRLAAHGPADWSAMPVVIRDLDNETMARQAWKENRDRRDLTAYEEARAIERYASEFSWSQKEIAEKLDLDRSTISNKLRLLRLPAPALALLERGELSERQAVALLPLAELPASAWPTNAFQIVYMDGRWRTTLDDVIAGAAKTNADNIREHVKSILNKLTVALDDQPWAKELWGTLSTVRCSTCKDCELRLKSTNRCPDVLCATDKRNAALRLQAAAAAEKARLPAVAIGRYGSYDNLSEVAITSLRAEAKRRGCGNLGVAVATGSAYLPRKVEGFEGCGIVCAHGEGKRCACRAATVVTKGPDSAAAQKKADKKQIKERYKEPAERAIAAAMADTPAGPAWLLLRRINGSAAQRLVGAPAPQIHAEIAVALVKEEIKYCFEYDVKLEDAKTKLTILLEAAKIARPWEEAEARPPLARPTGSASTSPRPATWPCWPSPTTSSWRPGPGWRRSRRTRPHTRNWRERSH